MADLFSGGDIDNDNLTRLRCLERGLVVTIFFNRKKPERRTLQAKLETRQLSWIRAFGGKPEGTRKFLWICLFIRGAYLRGYNGLFVVINVVHMQ